MKYPKVLQILALATAITVAAPNVVIPAYASETELTPQEYEEQYGYELPAGYHYVLSGEHVVLDENDAPVIEADAPAAPAVPETPAAPETPAGAEAPAETGTPAGSETPAEAGNPAETPADSEASAGTETPADSELQPETPSTPDNPETPSTPDNPETPSTPDNPETPEQPEIPDGAEETPPEDDPVNDGDSSDNTDGAGDTNNTGLIDIQRPEKILGDWSMIESPVEDGEDGQDAAVQPEASETPEAAEEAVSEPEEPSEQETPAEEEDPFYLTSAQFKALHDRIQYNVEVPIDGIPSFITQEMIVGALKAQDETGYPASVTIAQIIQESGYGKYGPGGEEGKGLSYLAFEYCNLFGIKGTGTAGSVSMKTSEMNADGSTYSTYAGFRRYHTYTECIEDRSKILDEVYSDLTEDVTDANTFAMKVGKRWATSLNYGKHLINTMRRYDLYRLDDMKLSDFNEMIGEFANPCPGSTITSLFGRRNAPIAGASTYHKGLDMGTGTYNIPTYAAKAGTVVFAGEAGACGNLVTIDHGDGLVTKYMHHAEIYVKEGDTVEKGQQIGLSGTTGNSTGNHLHFQVEENGRAVDPLKYLQASSEEAENAKAAYTKKQLDAVNGLKETKMRMLKEVLREKIKY